MDKIEKVNVSKVCKLVKETIEKLNKFNTIEQKVFFNLMDKADLLLDQELCENVVKVGFKRQTPQIKQMMQNMKTFLMDRLKKARGEE